MQSSAGAKRAHPDFRGTHGWQAMGSGLLPRRRDHRRGGEVVGTEHPVPHGRVTASSTGTGDVPGAPGERRGRGCLENPRVLLHCCAPRLLGTHACTPCTRWAYTRVPCTRLAHAVPTLTPKAFGLLLRSAARQGNGGTRTPPSVSSSPPSPGPGEEAPSSPVSRPHNCTEFGKSPGDLLHFPIPRASGCVRVWLFLYFPS